jgi:hypothetical protein
MRARRFQHPFQKESPDRRGCFAWVRQGAFISRFLTGFQGWESRSTFGVTCPAAPFVMTRSQYPPCTLAWPIQSPPEAIHADNRFEPDPVKESMKNEKGLNVPPFSYSIWCCSSISEDFWQYISLHSWHMQYMVVSVHNICVAYFIRFVTVILRVILIGERVWTRWRGCSSQI